MKYYRDRWGEESTLAEQTEIAEVKRVPCPGCKKNDPLLYNGILRLYDL
ncbi:hypothetical protein [Porphyromonas asaccharolytica]|nr:hypothetical protein [Porphyromonas asaccharolytica]